MKRNITIRSSAADVLTYICDNGKDAFEIRYEDENIWLTQKMMAELYGVDIADINHHIKKVFDDKELSESSTIKKYLIVQKEGSREISRNINHYNLQMIIAVGFKINNERAVQSRKWANNIVKQYTVKGWVMDDDYDSSSLTTKRFFANVQNKVHFAISDHTAAEIVYSRADSTKKNMGLTTWSDASSGKIKKSDVVVAKDYLSENEMKSLELLVNIKLISIRKSNDRFSFDYE